MERCEKQSVYYRTLSAILYYHLIGRILLNSNIVVFNWSHRNGLCILSTDKIQKNELGIDSVFEYIKKKNNENKNNVINCILGMNSSFIFQIFKLCIQSCQCKSILVESSPQGNMNIGVQMIRNGVRWYMMIIRMILIIRMVPNDTQQFQMMRYVAKMIRKNKFAR